MTSLMPRLAHLPSGRRRTVQAAFLLQWVLVVFAAICLVLPLPATGPAATVRDGAFLAAFLLSTVIGWLRVGLLPDRRLAWTLLALAYSVASLAWALALFWLYRLPGGGPAPSPSDALWLFLMYPLICGFIVALGWEDVRPERTLTAGLEAVIAGAGVAAIGGALLQTSQSPVAHSLPATLTRLADAFWGVVLVAVLFANMSMRRWWWDRVWGVIAAGCVIALLVTVAQNMLLLSGSSSGVGASHLGVDLGFLLAFAAGNIAGWQPSSTPIPGLYHRSVLVPPTVFSLSALAIVAYDRRDTLPWPVLALAVITLLAATLRLTLAFGELLTLAETRREAKTDELSGLPNRRAFLRGVEQALHLARRSSGTAYVMLLDLDDFKQVNDSLGHHAGDALLRLIGPRLRQALRPQDVVGRIGGDEFGVLLRPSPPDVGAAAVVAQRVIDVLGAPFLVEGLALHVTGSLGVAGFPADGSDVGELLKCADAAMYQAKRSPWRWEMYAVDRDENSPERLALAGRLVAAVRQGRIEVHLQPVAEAADGRVIGAEALARWDDDGVERAPAEFVAAATRAGLARPLTSHVLRLALVQARRWHAQGMLLAVSVNITAADLLDSAFPRDVAAALEEQRLPARALTLEVTESAIMSDPRRAARVMAGLRNLGVTLSLDDFGTGHSSLLHLRDLPVHELKIDHLFVSGMAHRPADEAIVAATVQLAHRLGVRVVAEGVEDERTWEMLRVLGCDAVQGFFIGRPVPPGEFADWLGACDADRPCPPAAARTLIG